VLASADRTRTYSMNRSFTKAAAKQAATHMHDMGAIDGAGAADAKENEVFSGFGDEAEDVWGDWRLERSQVSMFTKIGEGEYGEVHEGRLRGQGEYDGFVAKVAVKKLKKAEKLEEFFKEAKVMMNLRHEHLVNFYGVVLSGEPHLIVSELCEKGCLKDYLKTPAGKATAVEEMNRLIYQICAGMAHLEEQEYVHRDLAARNVLLDADSRAKVADFGMSRSVTEGVYKAGTDSVCPIRWTAPEAMHYGQFSCKSDVWSFGITACEILAYGEDPYEGIPNMHVIRLLEAGSRMNQLPTCSDDLYELLLDSWEEKAEDRPTFAELLPQLGNVAGL
jgi:serine/threonine protein kinase